MEFYEEIQKTAPGIAIGRYAKLLAKHRGSEAAAAYEAETNKNYKMTPSVGFAFKNAFNISQPFEVSAVARDFYELWRPQSVVGRLRDRFQAGVFFAPCLVESETPVCEFIAETIPAPIIKIQPFSEPHLLPHKCGGIVIVPEKFIDLDASSTETIIAKILTGAVAQAIDQEFLSDTEPSKSTPGGICHNSLIVTASVTTGGCPDKTIVGGDIANMVSKLESWRDPVFFLHPKTFSHLAALGLIDNGTLLGRETIQTVAATGRIVLADIHDILHGDEKKTSIAYTKTADLFTEVKSDGDEPTYERFRLSMFSGGYRAFSIIRYISWKRLHANSAVKMTVEF